MPKAGSRSVDKGIGARLKLYRQRAGFSQTALGRHLGVSFQQVQKYENGTNRISAATLIKITQFLNLSINDLLMDESKRGAKAKNPRNGVARFAKSREGASLIHAFLSIGDSNLRHQLVGLMKALGGPRA